MSKKYTLNTPCYHVGYGNVCFIDKVAIFRTKSGLHTVVFKVEAGVVLCRALSGHQQQQHQQ